MTKLAIITTETVSDTREVLRRAISERNEAQAAADAHANAITSAEAVLSDARIAVERALSGLASAKEAAAARLLGAVSSGTPRAPDRSLRESRERLSLSQDEADTATLALQSLQADDAEVERRSMMARNAVEAAARAVIAAAVPDLGAHTAKLHRRLEIAREALHFAVGCCKYPPTESDKRWASTAQLAIGLPGIRGDLKNEWREVFQSLQTNADAPLPRLENE
jgi:hypothetical protein